jgi:polyphosphate kinase
VLTPLAVDPGHPFPFISNLSLSLAVLLRHRKQGTTHFARIKLPKPRWLEVSGGDGLLQFAPIEALVAAHVDTLFPGMEVLNVHPFRVTRNADVLRDEEEAEDLLEMISAEVRERRFAPVVRLEVDKAMPAVDRELLVRELLLQPEDICEVEGLLDLTGLFRFVGIHQPALKDPPWSPVAPFRLQREAESKETRDIFAVIRRGDLLVHHPYDSFAASVEHLLRAAAEDPQVLAIKQTLYRTSDDSPIVKALIRAAEEGKQVAVLVEVTRPLRRGQQHRVGADPGERRRSRDLRRDGAEDPHKSDAHRAQLTRIAFAPTATSAPATTTPRLRCSTPIWDCSPAGPELGRDVVNLFHFLTGYAPGQRYEQVLVAPEQMRTLRGADRRRDRTSAGRRATGASSPR